MTDLEFLVVPGQIEVESILIQRATRLFAAFTIVTTQKYPETGACGGTDFWIGPSEYTPRRQLDLSLPAMTGIRLPAPWRGWEMLPEHLGRYSLTFAVHKPVSPARCREASFRAVTPDEWVRLVTQREGEQHD